MCFYQHQNIVLKRTILGQNAESTVLLIKKFRNILYELPFLLTFWHPAGRLRPNVVKKVQVVLPGGGKHLQERRRGREIRVALT